MKFRWWIAASLLVACGLLLQAGCGTKDADLPMQAAPDAPVEDTTADVDVPEPDTDMPETDTDMPDA